MADVVHVFWSSYSALPKRVKVLDCYLVFIAFIILVQVNGEIVYECGSLAAVGAVCVCMRRRKEEGEERECMCVAIDAVSVCGMGFTR